MAWNGCPPPPPHRQVRRESSTLEDMFVAHISSMDTFARGLKIAAKMQ
jgi:xylose isomerase